MYEQEKQMEYSYGYAGPTVDVKYADPGPKPTREMAEVRERGDTYIHVICSDTQDAFSLRVHADRDLDPLYDVLEGREDGPLTVEMQTPEEVEYSAEGHGPIPEDMPLSGVRVGKARLQNALVVGGSVVETIVPVFVTSDVFLDVLSQIQDQIEKDTDTLDVDFYRLTKNKMKNPDYKNLDENNYSDYSGFADPGNYSNFKK